MKYLVLFSILFSWNAQGYAETVELNENNLIVFNDKIDIIHSVNFVTAVTLKRALVPGTELLYILIYSSGGGYESAKTLSRFFNTLPQVKLICDFCASAAGFVFAEAHKGSRLITEQSQLMMHEMFLDHVTAKRIKDPESALRLISDSDEFNSEMARLIGITKADYEQRILDTEWRLKGVDIIRYHLADKLIHPKCSLGIKVVLPDFCRAP